MTDDILRARYERRAPSLQTMADVFAGSWKSRLPGVESTGDAAMFSDARIQWLDSVCDGRGLVGKSALELGPFEGYQSLALKKSGIRDLVSIEANTINFLKCLVVKSMYNIDVDFRLGDATKYLESAGRKFDLVFASGILYHLQEPVKFLELACNTAAELYIWSHYWSGAIDSLRNGQERHFVPGRNKSVEVCGRKCTLHARSYLINKYEENIPMYWEGGPEDITYWLAKEDILFVLESFGFRNVKIHADTELNGLPVISLYASRGPTKAELA